MEIIKKLLKKREKIMTDPLTQPTTGDAFVIFDKVITVILKLFF
jgi:hypothetical protein